MKIYFCREGLRIIRELLQGELPHDEVLERPGSIYAEAIRTLRTALLLSNVDRPPRVILITSSICGLVGHRYTTEAYVMVKDGALYLFGSHISPLATASTHVHPDPLRTRMRQASVDAGLTDTQARIAQDMHDGVTQMIIGALYVGSVKDAGFNQAMHDSIMEVQKNIPCVKIIEAENGNVVIRNLLIKDYPIILRLTKSE